jgi:hypothetical protein
MASVALQGSQLSNSSYSYAEIMIVIITPLVHEHAGAHIAAFEECRKLDVDISENVEKMSQFGRRHFRKCRKCYILIKNDECI